MSERFCQLGAMLALALLAGCGDADSPSRATAITEPASTQAPPPAVEAPAAPVRRLDPLPAFAPVYPGATVEANMVESLERGGAGMVSMISADKPETVIDFYHKTMERHGFALETEARTPQGMILAGRARDGHTLMVTVSKRDDGRSAIALVIGADR